MSPSEEKGFKVLFWALSIFVPVNIGIMGYMVKEIITMQLGIARGEAIPDWFKNVVAVHGNEIEKLKQRCQQ